LLNIAFENPRKIRVQVDGNVGGISKKKQKSKVVQNDKSTESLLSGRYNPDYLVPDRSAGLSELEELRRLCPGRQWNFVSPHGRMRTCRLDPWISGRNRCTIRRISSCPANCEIHHVALSDSHGSGRSQQPWIYPAHRFVYGIEPCNGAVFRGAWRWGSEKQPNRSSGTL
jgi:hypothetical protein